MVFTVANKPLLFCLSGTGTSRCAEIITKHGGKISPRVTKNVDYLIECSHAHGPVGYTNKIETAEKYLIPYLSMTYVQDCVQRGSIINDFKPYKMVL
jgi:NAD-dependent DNA ligase